MTGDADDSGDVPLAISSFLILGFPGVGVIVAIVLSTLIVACKKRLMYSAFTLFHFLIKSAFFKLTCAV